MCNGYRNNINIEMTDYYEVLRVHQSVSQEEIKESYRRLAHKYHPDMEGGDALKFKEILEAFNVLSDPYKRGVYDTQMFYGSPHEAKVAERVSESRVVEKKAGMGGWGWVIFIVIIVFVLVALNS
jgi:DnaJ-class molecular chaperone